MIFFIVNDTLLLMLRDIIVFLCDYVNNTNAKICVRSRLVITKINDIQIINENI